MMSADTPTPPEAAAKMARAELEPCPWCWKPLTPKKAKINPYSVCRTEGCFGQRMPVVSTDVPEDIAAWNKRAEPARDAGMAAEVERLRAVLRRVAAHLDQPVQTTPVDTSDAEALHSTVAILRVDAQIALRVARAALERSHGR